MKQKIKETQQSDRLARWEKLVEWVEAQFQPEGEVELDNILFLIGVQELGQGFRRYKKDEKVNLLHIAICRVLEPYGFYRFKGTDVDGWPHYELLEKLPPLKAGEQSWLMKEAALRYFEESGILNFEKTEI